MSSKKEAFMTEDWTPRTPTPTSKTVAVSYGRVGSISRAVIMQQRVRQTRVVRLARIGDLSTANAA
jgi:hypothetical protein